MVKRSTNVLLIRDTVWFVWRVISHCVDARPCNDLSVMLRRIRNCLFIIIIIIIIIHCRIVLGRPSHGHHREIVTSNRKSDCLLMFTYVKNIPAKFHPDPVWNDRALDFFWRQLPNKKKNRNKMSNDIRSVPDLLTVWCVTLVCFVLATKTCSWQPRD